MDSNSPDKPDYKDESALRTIGEVSRMTGIPQHVLRYWEGRFPDLRPLQRAGGRRLYRPTDLALVERIQQLLHSEGFTADGARKQITRELAEGRIGKSAAVPMAAAPIAPAVAQNAAALPQAADAGPQGSFPLGEPAGTVNRPAPAAATSPTPIKAAPTIDLIALRRIRDRLADALADA